MPLFSNVLAMTRSTFTQSLCFNKRSAGVAVCRRLVAGRRSLNRGASSVVEQRAQLKTEAEAVRDPTAATRWSESP